MSRAAIGMNAVALDAEVALFGALHDLAIVIGPARATRVAIRLGIALTDRMSAPMSLDDPHSEGETP